jgi:hypothetical protein
MDPRENIRGVPQSRCWEPGWFAAFSLFYTPESSEVGRRFTG